MPPRRPHRKSRNGCDSCKKRRVKCDEHGPPCTNCVTREIECSFSHPGNISKSATPNLTPTPTPTLTHSQSAAPTSVPSITTLYSQNRLLELELLHHYTTTTYRGLSFRSSDTINNKNLWRDVVVAEALKFEFLLKEIFALASLQKAAESLDPETSSKYAERALEYQNEASALFRNALGNVTEENCTGIFIFSIMMMIFAIAPHDSIEGRRTGLENIILLFEFQKGTRSVVDVARSWLKTSPFRFIFGPRTPATPNETSPKYTIAISNIKQINDNSSPHLSNSRREIYRQAIEMLHSCFGSNDGIVLAWFARVGQDFVDELKRGEPMALLILVHWAVALERLGHLWWARGSGRRLVEELTGTLKGWGGFWEDATLWARTEVGLCETMEDKYELSVN